MSFAKKQNELIAAALAVVDHDLDGDGSDRDIWDLWYEPSRQKIQARTIRVTEGDRRRVYTFYFEGVRVPKILILDIMFGDDHDANVNRSIVYEAVGLWNKNQKERRGVSTVREAMNRYLT